MLGQSHRASLGEELQTFSHLDGHTMARLVSIAPQVRSLNPELHHSKGHDPLACPSLPDCRRFQEGCDPGSEPVRV